MNIVKNEYKENAHIYLLSNISHDFPSLAVWKNVTEREHFTKY